MVDEHTLRYAKIDFLYWYQFQNYCRDIVVDYSKFLDGISSNQELVNNKATKDRFLSGLHSYEIICVGLFDILNCDKCTNVAWFALSEELFDVFFKVCKLTVIGIHKEISKIIELFDSLLILCATCKVMLKFKGPNDLP